MQEIRDRKYTSFYYTYVGGNLVTWNKKQSVVSHFNVEVEYRVMAHRAYEVMLKFLLWELRFSVDSLMPMYCDNQLLFTWL